MLTIDLTVLHSYRSDRQGTVDTYLPMSMTGQKKARRSVPSFSIRGAAKSNVRTWPSRRQRIYP